MLRGVHKVLDRLLLLLRRGWLLLLGGLLLPLWGSLSSAPICIVAGDGPWRDGQVQDLPLATALLIATTVAACWSWQTGRCQMALCGRTFLAIRVEQQHPLMSTNRKTFAGYWLSISNSLD